MANALVLWIAGLKSRKSCSRKGYHAKMRIPKRFKLLGHTIEVKNENERYYEKNSYGACSYEGKWIKLVQPSEHHPITQGSLEQTFLHEVVHLCLNHTEQSALNDNE